MAIENPYDIVIVGAGMSGLTAGLKLKQKEKSLNILIIESSSRIGGQLSNSVIGEIGSKWLTEDQYHMYNILKSLKVNLQKKHCSTNSNFPRSWDIDVGYLSKIRKFEINRFINEVDSMCLNYRPGRYSLKTDTQTMHNYLCSRLFFRKSREFIEVYVRLICGINSKYITVPEFMSICCSSGGLSKLITMYTGLSNELIEFSSTELFDIIERILDPSIILKETKIVEILHYTNYVIARDEFGNLYHSEILILALPWNLVKELNIYPQLPSELKTPLHHNKYLITSFIATYNDNHWKNEMLSGSYFSLDNPKIIGYEYKTTGYSGIVIHDENNIELISQQIILNKLAETFGEKMLMPSFYIQRTFEQNLLLNLPQTTPWNRLIWASTCSATVYRGYLGGAVQSGLRAAVHALLIIRPQNVNWHDIDEIQRANAVQQKINWLYKKIIKLNLYDIIFYSLLGAAVFGMIKVPHTLWKSHTK